MNRFIPIISVVGISILILVVGLYSYDSKPIPPVTQQDLRLMIDDWMNNSDRNDLDQRLEIMKAYYTFEESGQKLTDDQDGRVMLNQIRKMISFDIPKTELDQIKQDIRNDLKEKGFEIKE
ncbi:MAG: proteinase inhibitor [Nitrosopumilus sp.]|uniref:proteinase inhibitor n=1 Tax=Nitrosopumilus sp. TaxID=2024843 RepID=UPI00247B945D|nr:proteinase inhibitor [Nitrosopumilus sp.]MCV0392729.1 proteinase inhibitor [Nitrosopumilus sp.]